MNTVTANELKTKGISAIKAGLKENDAVIISVRGKARFVILDIEQYARMRQYELAATLQEARAEVDAGQYTAESVAEHVKRVTDDL